jgi:hypothetical protein
MIFIDSYEFANLLLDDYPATLAYSLRKLRASYTGSAIRVRRSSDNAETDIGFVDNKLDTASLLSHCGDGNGFVKNWYNQGALGSVGNATQSIALSQPRIVTTGVVNIENGKPSLVFNDDPIVFNGDRLLGVHGNSFPSAAYSFGVWKATATGQAQYVLGTLSNNGFSVFNEGITTKLRISGSEEAQIASVYNTQQLITAGALATSGYIQINNGVPGTSVSAYVAATNIVTIGSVNSTGIYSLNGNIQELIIYNSDQTANRTAIQSNINSHYSIY